MRRAGAILQPAVAYDGACWHTLDPATLLITSHVTNLSGEGFAFICANEYLQDDVSKFASLAGRRAPVGILSFETGGRPERSARFREIYSARGWGAEMRASFDAGGMTWGSVMLLRQAGRPDFTPAEAGFLVSASRHVAHGIRTTLLSDAGAAGGDEEAPGVVVVDARGEVESATPAARVWVAELAGEEPPDGGPLPAAVLAVAAQARRAVADCDAAPARSHVRAPSGRWLTLHAAPLSDVPDGRIAVIVQVSRPAELALAIAAAHGLTGREREVLGAVLRGRSTTEIAAALHLSPYTVQDHLMAIFEKPGARNRAELAGRLFYRHFEPRLRANAPVGADGWFAGA